MFRAEFDTGDIVIWHDPCIWQHVFRMFKMHGQYMDTRGVLCCNGIPIRETGNRLKREPAELNWQALY